MWSFPAKIWPKNAKNYLSTWRPRTFKTSTFGITWCEQFQPNLRLEFAKSFHIRWRMLAAHTWPSIAGTSLTSIAPEHLKGSHSRQIVLDGSLPEELGTARKSGTNSCSSRKGRNLYKVAPFFNCIKPWLRKVRIPNLIPKSHSSSCPHQRQPTCPRSRRRCDRPKMVCLASPLQFLIWLRFLPQSLSRQTALLLVSDARGQGKLRYQAGSVNAQCCYLLFLVRQC